MKNKSFKFSSILFMAVVIVICAVCFFTGHHHAGYMAMSAPGMIGSQDMRIAYTNAYRSLYAKATDNGRLTGKMGDANGPSWLPNVGNKILSQSDLISDIVINVNKTNYQFGINVNQLTNGQSGIFPAERRLNLQDTFFVASVGYYFKMYQTGGGATNYQSTLFTHIPGWFFGGAGGFDITNDSLWDGNLALSINNRTVVTEWDLWRHHEVPTTQYPVFESLASDALLPVNDETYGGQSGMYPAEPMWILDGSYDNVLNVGYNNGLADLNINNNIVHMQVRLRGILAQNCGKIMEPGLANPA